jgi:hypothetical protein
VFRFRLYLKERELATNITSICLHSDFLLATTLDHRFDQKDILLSERRSKNLYTIVFGYRCQNDDKFGIWGCHETHYSLKRASPKEAWGRYGSCFFLSFFRKHPLRLFTAFQAEIADI